MAQQQLAKRYDIIINGGGIVGFTLLNLLLHSPTLNRHSVILIERASNPGNLKYDNRTTSDDIGQDGSPDRKFSNRVSSITLNSEQTFAKLGVWSKVKPYAKKVKQIKVWNYNYADKIIFKQKQLNQTKFIHDKDVIFSVVENNVLSSALLEKIYSLPKGRESIIWNHELKDLTSKDGLVNIEIQPNKNSCNGNLVNLAAPLIVGCDGFNSKVRDLTKISYKECNLNKTAVVGTVQMATRFDGESQHNDIAYQRFSAEKDTVAALLPLDDKHCSFVISAPTDYAKHLIDCDDETFIDEFNMLLSAQEYPANTTLKVAHEVSNSVYDRIQSLIQMLPPSIRPDKYNYQMGSGDPPCLESVLAGSRASFPLHFGTTSPKMTATLLSKYPQVALLGDAAHRVHPLAGQGLNLGIQDATVLVKHLEKLSRVGERLFNEADLKILAKVLGRFELERQAYIIPMSVGILCMQPLFSAIPSRTLSSVDKCEFVKNASVTMANGCS